MHWDGVAWSNWALDPPNAPYGTVLGFWGSAPDDVWTAGSDCNYFYPFDPVCSKTVFHFNGLRWEPSFIGPGVHSIAEELVAISGADSADLWVLAAHNAAHHWDGEKWSEADISPMFFCRSLWARATDDVFGTCSRDVIHWDGRRWSLVPTITAQLLTGLWGTDSQLWAVGEWGTIARRDEPVRCR